MRGDPLGTRRPVSATTSPRRGTKAIKACTSAIPPIQLELAGVLPREISAVRRAQVSDRTSIGLKRTSMANVDAEQNAAPTQQGEGTRTFRIHVVRREFGSSSTGRKWRWRSLRRSRPRWLSSATQPGAHRRDAETQSAGQTTKIEQAEKEEPIASLASLQGAPPMEAVAAAAVRSFACSRHAAADHPAPQPDVNSKLALISAIKQRRAITVRPEPSAEAQSFAPVEPAANLREEEQSEPVAEHVAPDTEAAQKKKSPPRRKTPPSQTIAQCRPAVLRFRVQQRLAP